jgi:hypothetical protein
MNEWKKERKKERRIIWYWTSLCDTALQAGIWRVRFPWGHWDFSLTSFRPHYGFGVNSAPNRNEYWG